MMSPARRRPEPGDVDVRPEAVPRKEPHGPRPPGTEGAPLRSRVARPEPDPPAEPQRPAPPARPQFDLDEELVRQAQAILGPPELTATLNQALRGVIDRDRSERLLNRLKAQRGLDLSAEVMDRAWR